MIGYIPSRDAQPCNSELLPNSLWAAGSWSTSDLHADFAAIRAMTDRSEVAAALAESRERGLDLCRTVVRARSICPVGRTHPEAL
jgi:hypothetical protein